MWGPSKRVYCLNSLGRSTLFGGDLEIIGDSMLIHLNLQNLQLLPNLLKQIEPVRNVKSEGAERREMQKVAVKDGKIGGLYIVSMIFCRFPQ